MAKECAHDTAAGQLEEGQRLAETDLSTHLELDHLDLVGYDGRLVALVEGGIEHLDGIGVKLVGKAWPLE